MEVDSSKSVRNSFFGIMKAVLSQQKITKNGPQMLSAKATQEAVEKIFEQAVQDFSKVFLTK